MEGVSQTCSRISSNAMIYDGTCAAIHATPRPTKAEPRDVVGTRSAFLFLGYR